MYYYLHGRGDSILILSSGLCYLHVSRNALVEADMDNFLFTQNTCHVRSHNLPFHLGILLVPASHVRMGRGVPETESWQHAAHVHVWQDMHAARRAVAR